MSPPKKTTTKRRTTNSPARERHEISPAPERLIAAGDLRARFGIPYNRVWLWRMARKGDFPSPIKLADGGRAMYLESEIVTWLRSRPRVVKHAHEEGADARTD